MAVFIGAIKGAVKLTARAKKNQTNINKAIYWYNRYSYFVNMDEYPRKQEDAWNKYVDYLNELPKSEQKRLEKLLES